MSQITDSLGGPRPIVVGVAELRSASAPEVLATHALGSCIGVTVWDPVTRVGGLLHYMLATPSDRAKAEQARAMYAVSGVPALFREVYALGAVKERLIVCAAGGAGILADSVGFDIGKRNQAILRRLFIKNGIALHAEDVGGSDARHLYLDLSTGTVTVRINNKEHTLWQR